MTFIGVTSGISDSGSMVNFSRDWKISGLATTFAVGSSADGVSSKTESFLPYPLGCTEKEGGKKKFSWFVFRKEKTHYLYFGSRARCEFIVRLWFRCLLDWGFERPKTGQISHSVSFGFGREGRQRSVGVRLDGRNEVWFRRGRSTSK